MHDVFKLGIIAALMKVCKSIPGCTRRTCTRTPCAQAAPLSQPTPPTAPLPATASQPKLLLHFAEGKSSVKERERLRWQATPYCAMHCSALQLCSNDSPADDHVAVSLRTEMKAQTNCDTPCQLFARHCRTKSMWQFQCLMAGLTRLVRHRRTNWRLHQRSGPMKPSAASTTAWGILMHSSMLRNCVIGPARRPSRGSWCHTYITMSSTRKPDTWMSVVRRQSIHQSPGMPSQ